MKLKKLFKDLTVEIKGSKEIEISGVSSHSQFIAPGNLFIAKKGSHFDGAEFIAKAVETGAAAILTDIYNPFLQGVVQVITPHVNELEGLLAKRYYETAKLPLSLIGITGTNGKTTTSYLIQYLLKDYGLMGTIETIIGKQRFPARLTTADVVTNHKTLREMSENGLKGAVMEVTSHALDQNRVEGIHFDIGIFLNLSQDHLDYHKTMDAYLAAKLKLIKQAKHIVYNKDDAAFEQIKKGFSFGIESEADLRAGKLQFSLDGTSFDLHYQGKSYPFRTKLVGRYNVYNCLAAIAAGILSGESLATLQKRLSTFPGVPGRLERIENERGLYLFVDFAHTPDALTQVLTTLHPLKKGKIITVFGCGGDRDAGKRPKMAQAVEEFSDHIIITSDNPRSEDPETICKQVAAGLTEKKPIIEVDRRTAIQRGISMAETGDIVLIAGRGHEPFQKIGNRLIPFDDRQVVRELSNQ